MQFIIVLAIAVVLYIFLRKEKKIRIKEKQVIKYIKDIDYKRYISKIKRKLKKIKPKPKKSPISKMIAEQKYIELITKNPRNIIAYLKLGQLYQQQGNFADAKGCFQQILRLEPNNKTAKKELKNLPS